MIDPSEIKDKRIAITAGSRGIDQIARILSILVVILREYGAHPYIIPAMGSHGGATAEGQISLLAELGITESSLGAPILSSMETVVLGHLSNGLPVHFDRLASQADGIILVNRIKPHTDYAGDIESGLAKMAVIGLGKLDGANAVHRYGWQGLRDLVPEAARLVISKAPILFGLAILENAYHETAQVTGVNVNEIAGTQEKELLKQAYRLLPRFPFAEIDVLVVDEIGKNISGVGMDPKVIGRVKVHGVPDLAPCSIRTIAVLGLTSQTHGNATGVGLADVTTRRLLEQYDFETTYLNCITSGITGIQRAAIPVVAPTEKAAIETALRVSGCPDPLQARIVHVKNTLALGEMEVSLNLLNQVLPENSIELVGDPFSLQFDEPGNLRDQWISHQERLP